MAKKEKHLCKWSPEAATKKKYVKLVSEPRWYCAKCLRVARKKAVLCNPKPLTVEKK